jgi:GntR family transcriptional regulator/MocR family aminotransferase
MIPESCLGPRGKAGRAIVSAESPGSPEARIVRYPPLLMKTEPYRMVQGGPDLSRIDFWYGNANARNFPEREWRQLLVENLVRIGRNICTYGPPEGALELRQAIAQHISVNRAIAADPDQIIITAGTQEGLNLISRLFVRPGVRIAVEDPCYKGAALLFRSYGGTLVPVPVDQNGACTDALAGCGASLAYVTPSHQFPTGATMSEERRANLLEWAETSGAYIVEDDYDSDFRHDGPPLTALAGLYRNSSVIYLGTFSKSIGAGIRTGYLVVPKHLVEPMREAKSLANYGHPWIEQVLLAEFIAQGHFSRHLRRIRHAYGLARKALLNGLNHHFGATRISGAEAGMHIMWTLPSHFPSLNQTVAIAAAEGVILYTLEAAGAHEIATSSHPRALVLGYGSLEPEAIEKGIARLRRGLESSGYPSKP